MAPPLPRSALHQFKAEFFKALAHPIRIQILETLRRGERSVQELQTDLALEQPIISQHLAVLRSRHVVATRKDGTTVRYAMRHRGVADLLDVARAIFNSQLTDSQRMLRELQREARAGRER